MSSGVVDKAPGPVRKLPPDWSPLPEPPEHKGASRVGVALRAGVAIAVVVILWRLGHELPAVILLTVGTVITVASAASPAVAERVTRVEAAIQRIAGRGLRFIVLSLIQVVVFAPLALLLRILRRNPLDPQGPVPEGTFWRAVPDRGSRPLHRRPFTLERPAQAAAPGRDRFPLSRLRMLLGVVALLVLVDLALGAGVDALRGDAGADGASGQGSLLLYPDVGAGRDEPWREQLGDEITEAWQRKRYHPFLAWTMAASQGEHVNVRRGIRRSYEPAGSQARDALEVFFFGGSTMFGMFQRDEHTIPSEFARMAEADGTPVRVVNYGRLAYANWQEVLLLEKLISRGTQPDLAVFYDGANELVGQFGQGHHSEPKTVLNREISSRLAIGLTDRQEDDGSSSDLYEAWAEVSAGHGLAERLGLAREPTSASEPALVSPWVGDQSDRPRLRGRNAASIHARGVDLARRLSDSYGFRSAFFWQPLIYSKRVRPGEEELVGSLGTDPAAWRSAYGFARSRLKAPVVDIAGGLDGVEEPVMYDFVHTNERGAREIAGELYRRLRPQLRELQANKPR
jgi:hypothetical protein